MLGLTGGPPAPPAFLPCSACRSVILGLYFMFGGVLLPALGQAEHVLRTDEPRALIVRHLRGRSVDAIILDSVPSIQTSVRADGSGNDRVRQDDAV